MGVLWTPSSLAPAIWLRPWLLPSVDLDGATVLRIYDQSDNNRDAVRASLSNPMIYPKGFNNRPLLALRGYSGFISINNSRGLSRNTAQISIFAIARRDSGSDLLGTLLSCQTSLLSSTRAYLALQNGTVYANGKRLDSDSTQTHAVSANTAQLGLYGAIFDYANAQLYLDINGVLNARPGGFQTAGPTSDTDSAYDPVCGNFGSANLHDLYGVLLELIVISGPLSTEDRQRTEGYLLHQHGLSALLPADHPYKSAPLSFGVFGNRAIKADNSSGCDTVVIRDWTSKELVMVVTPDSAGDWEADLPEGSYDVTYFEDGCAPLCEGPYNLVLP